MIEVVFENLYGRKLKFQANPETTLDEAVAFAEAAVYDGTFDRSAVIVDGEIYCEYES